MNDERYIEYMKRRLRETKCSTWVADNHDMHDKFQVRDWCNDPDNAEKLRKFLRFRLDFIEEELKETNKAYMSKDAEELVDGLIDICVVAIGTLNAFNIDADKAWKEVHKANMAKETGVKPSRPNPLGLPDMVKPEGWEGPSHKGNHGLLKQIFKRRK